MAEEDIDYIKGHEKAINDPAPADFFRSNPEKVRVITEREKASFYKNLDEYDKRFHSLIPYIQNTRIYMGSITEKTRIAACFLLFHKAIQTWEAIVLLSKQGFYTEAMELTRSTSENMDLANMFIFGDADGVHMAKWFSGKVIGNKEARASFEDAFNAGGFFTEDVPIAKVMASMYHVMSQYTHGGYAILLEMINMYTKDFDYDKSVGFHRLDEEDHVLKNLVNKIHYSLIFFYIKLAVDKNIVNELNSLVPEPDEKMSPEELKKNYKNTCKMNKEKYEKIKNEVDAMLADSIEEFSAVTDLLKKDTTLSRTRLLIAFSFLEVISGIFDKYYNLNLPNSTLLKKWMKEYCLVQKNEVYKNH